MSTNKIKILDKSFEISISAKELEQRVAQMAAELNVSLINDDVVFVAVLNGAFMFASDLFKKITLNSKISFIKLASYSGTTSTNRVRQLIGLNEDLKGKTVVILEDIIDTGQTLKSICKQLSAFDPEKIIIATLLFKPDAFQFDYTIDYIGFNIPNEFIVGYGLDYNGFGRNMESIYTLCK